MRQKVTVRGKLEVMSWGVEYQCLLSTPQYFRDFRKGKAAGVEMEL